MIETCAGLIFALATPLLAGHGILRLLARGDAVGHLPERLALTWLLGAGYISLALFLCGLAVNSVALPVIVAVGAIALFIAGSRRPLARMESQRLTPVEWLLVGLLALQAAVILWCARNFLLGWDGIAVWEIKAQIAFRNGGTLPAAYFGDITRADSHPRYPLCWPGIGSWLYLCLGRVDQSWMRVLGAVFYATTAGLLTGAVQRLGKSRTAGLIAAACLFFLPILIASPHGIHAGYADFPLAAFYLAAACRTPGWRTNTSPSDRRLFAVLAMLVVWTKADGVVLLAALLAAAWLALGWRRWPRVLPLAAPAVALLAIYNVYLHQVGALADHNYASPTPAHILANIDRLGPVILAMLEQAIDWRQWSLLWPGAAFALLTLARRGHRRGAALLLVLLALPVLGYTFVYVLSTWPGHYLLHVRISVSRLFIGFAPVALLAVGLALSCCRENRDADGKAVA